MAVAVLSLDFLDFDDAETRVNLGCKLPVATRVLVRPRSADHLLCEDAGEDLNRDITTQFPVPCPVHLAHPAFADLRRDHVRAESATRMRRNVRRAIQIVRPTTRGASGGAGKARTSSSLARRP